MLRPEHSIEDAYILGLWCADGYHRSSSIGLTNTKRVLIERFADWLRNHFPKERLRLKVYGTEASEWLSEISPKIGEIRYYSPSKMKKIAYQIYVNSRPLLREFRQCRTEVGKLPKTQAIAYIKGRFDGDGSISQGKRSWMRIVYGNQQEAMMDQQLIQQRQLAKVTLYEYKQARTWCLYFSQQDVPELMEKFESYHYPVETDSTKSRCLADEIE